MLILKIIKPIKSHNIKHFTCSNHILVSLFAIFQCYLVICKIYLPQFPKLMANGLLVWSEGESLESTVSNLPWFMVCLFHETGKKKEGRGVVPVIPANKRGAGCLCSGLILFFSVCYGERCVRFASEINCFFMALWSLKETEKKISLDKTASRFAKRWLNYICQRKGLSFISETQFQALVAVKIKELHGNNPIELQKHKPFVHMQPCYKCKSVVWAWLQQRFTQKHLENCSYYCDDYCNYSRFNGGQNVDNKRVQG